MSNENLENLKKIKQLLEQKIYELETFWTQNHSKEETIFWNWVENIFWYYMQNNSVDTLENIIVTKISNNFIENFNWTEKKSKLNEIIKSLLYETTKIFNNSDKFAWKYILPIDEFIIVNIIDNKEIYWASLWKPIDFKIDSISFFADKLNLLNPWESIQAWWQIWDAPDIVVKLCDKYVLIMNNTTHSINELDQYWNWNETKIVLQKHINEIIKTLC